MILDHRGQAPTVHESAYIAPTATVCGDVTVGENACVLFGAVVTADGGPVEIGADSIVMEQAVVRGTPAHPLTIGDNVLVGPRAYLTGCTIEDAVFLATGCSVFNGATISRGCEVRINATVHIKSVVSAGSVVPIGWVAVGDPAECFPPGEHEAIWERQKPLDFPTTVFGLDRDAIEDMMPTLTERYGSALRSHRADTEIGLD